MLNRLKYALKASIIVFRNSLFPVPASEERKKNKVFISPTEPTGEKFITGDLWYQRQNLDGSIDIINAYHFADGEWINVPITRK